MSLPNPSMSFSPFAILTADEMNDLVENDQALAAGTGLNDSAITTAKIANGAVTTSKTTFSGAKVKLTTTQAIPNATTIVVAFDAEVFDTESYHDNATNNSRLTVPRTGYYTFTINLNWASWTTGGRMICNIKKNGSVLQELWDTALSGSGEPSLTLTYTTNATANDYFQIDVYQDTGGGKTIDGTTSFAVVCHGV